MNTKLKIIIGAVVVLGLAGAGGAWYLGTAKPAADGAQAQAQVKKPKSDKPLKYITLDKVIVMLRRDAGNGGTHYLSTDLVLATTADQEKQAKDHLPLLRSIAVRALSTHTMSEASGMTVEQFAEQLNQTFDASYASTESEKPFSEVMIGKLIIE